MGLAGHAIALRRTSDTDSGRATPPASRIVSSAARSVDVAEQQVLLGREPHAQTQASRPPAHRAAQRRREPPVLDGDPVEALAARPGRASRGGAASAAAAPAPRSRAPGWKRDFSSARTAVDAEPSDRVLPARLPAVLPLAVLLLEDRDRARRRDHLLAADPAEVEPEQRARCAGCCASCRARRRCRDPRGCRRRARRSRPGRRRRPASARRSSCRSGGRSRS